MERFSASGWRFAVDRQATAVLYRGQAVGFAGASIVSNELRALFDRFGVDIRKPMECTEDRYEAAFKVFGEASSDAGYELDFLSGQGCVSLVICPEKNEYGGAAGHFTVLVEGYNSLLQDGMPVRTAQK